MRWPWDQKREEAEHLERVVEDASKQTQTISTKLDHLEQRNERLRIRTMHPIVQVVVYRKAITA